MLGKDIIGVRVIHRGLWNCVKVSKNVGLCHASALNPNLFAYLYAIFYDCYFETN